MFDIGWSELLVIAIVAIIVVGPKDLPRLMRSFGHYAGRLRRAAAEFQRQFEESMQEAELEEVRQAMADMRDTAASLDLGASIDQPVMRPKPEAPAAPKPVPKPKRTKVALPAKSRSAKPRAAKAQAPKAKSATTRMSARRASKTQTSKGKMR